MEKIKVKPLKPLPEPKLIKKPITFSPLEWDYFVEEVKLRGIDKFEQCINNARYLAELDSAEASEYRVVVSMDELEAMARDE